MRHHDAALWAGLPGTHIQVMADAALNLIGPLTTIGLAAYAALDTALLTRANQWLPRVVDATLAAASVVVSISLVHAMDRNLPVRLFDSKMMSSAVVFCTNAKPPSPHAFIACSACSFVAGVLIHFLGSCGLAPEAVAVGIHVLFAKLSGCSFSSAVGLTAFVGISWADDSWAEPLHCACPLPDVHPALPL